MNTAITFDDISPNYLSTSKFESILETLDEIGIKCTFFVVPGKDEGRFLETGFRSSLKTALSLGHELSLHGYEHSENEFGYLSIRSYSVPLFNVPFPSFNSQKKKIESAIDAFKRITSVRPLGFRAPKYLLNNQTLRALTTLGFRYDSSKTLFKPAHGASLRLRWTTHCNPYQLSGLIEIPVTGDYTYCLTCSNFLEQLERAIQDFEWVKSHDGVFVVTVHPNRSDEKLLSKFLSASVDVLHQKTKFVRLIDQIDMYM